MMKRYFIAISPSVKHRMNHMGNKNSYGIDVRKIEIATFSISGDDDVVETFMRTHASDIKEISKSEVAIGKR